MKLKKFSTTKLKTNSDFTGVNGNSNKAYKGNSSGAGFATGCGVTPMTLKCDGRSEGGGQATANGAVHGLGSGKGKQNKGINYYERKAKHQSEI